MEEWRDVVGWEGTYSVSNLGRVRSDRQRRGVVVGRILRPGRTGKKPQYLAVALCKHCKGNMRKVHRLVAAAFIGPCPEGKEVNHKNGDFFDNRAENLEYVTRSENMLHACHVLKCHRARGERSGLSKLTTAKVKKMRDMVSRGLWTIAEAGRAFSVSDVAAAAAIKRHTWAHVA